MIIDITCTKIFMTSRVAWPEIVSDTTSTPHLDLPQTVHGSMYSPIAASLFRGNARALLSHQKCLPSPLYQASLRYRANTITNSNQCTGSRGTWSRARKPERQKSELLLYSGTILFLGGSFYVAYKSNETFRHSCLAAVRCSRVARWYFCNSSPIVH